MVTRTYTGSYSLMRQLAGLEGNWVGDVSGADGTPVGREQLSCAWNTERTMFRLTSCLVSRTGRVLGAEQAHLVYDHRADSITALFRTGGRTDLARAYANAQNELVLVSDGALRLRRFTALAPGGPLAPLRDTWHHCVEVATDGRMSPEWQAVLHRV